MPQRFLSIMDLPNLSADPSTTGFVGGEMYWNTSLVAVRVWSGSVWNSLGLSIPVAPLDVIIWGTD